MNISRYIVTDLKEVLGGQTYIRVTCLHGRISLDTELVVGAPFYPKVPGFSRSTSPFYRHRTNSNWSKTGVYDNDHSLLDSNVLPNTYNDHSMWRFNSSVLSYLKECREKGRGGILEYLAILAKYQRGGTFHGNMSFPGLGPQDPFLVA